eukprot:9087308-Heterocapsa_arctica.AAC.1
MTGVRIGEARKPGQEEKQWSGVTANITSWNTSGLAWAVREETEFVLLQETKLVKKQTRGAKSAAHRMGRSVVFNPAVASTKKGINIGGVGIMVKHPRKVRQIMPHKEQEHFSKGRWIHAITEGTCGA